MRETEKEEVKGTEIEESGEETVNEIEIEQRLREGQRK